MKKTLEFRAHDGEIEDIALGPDNKVGVGWLPSSLAVQDSGLRPLCCVQQVVTAGRDFQCCVWQQDQLVTGLRWHENLPGIPDKAYRYQACRDSGTFLGLGTVTGSVAIHIAFSLQVSWGRAVGQPRWPPNSPSPLVSPQRLYYVKEAHGIVVTDVAFVPESRPGRELLGGHEAALLSVAVDSRCKLHLLPTRRSLPVWLLLLLCAGLIVATILLLQLAFPGFL
ncbi:PREB protein, partial [Leptocoma aspasia]|nr:PREB protein [Leptocoma aspasia]